MVIGIVERVKSQESRVSVFRLAQPVGRGNGQQERNYYSKHGQCMICGVTVWLKVSVFLPLLKLGLGALVHGLVV